MSWRLTNLFTAPRMPTAAIAPPIEPEENFDLIADPFIRIDKSGCFKLSDIELIAETHKAVGDTLDTVWDHLRNKYLTLPDWYEPDLDPLSEDYFAQQMRLWHVLSGVDRPYEPGIDEEEEKVAGVDAIRRPGFFIRRGRSAVRDASDHMLAAGMIMKHSGLEPGMWALEYGAGFGHAALTLARMGVNVDTVDISATFCGYVKEQADFFDVNLTPFNARFGENPRGDQKYDLIWFYESFHHCVDFRAVVPLLKNHLTPNGKILLAGEPIGKREYPAVPYPWGLRLESEVVAVIRNRHWFELGFSEDFIAQLFTSFGYTAECFECPASIFGLVYCFSPRASKVELGSYWLPYRDAEGWHTPESGGRWTREVSSMALDQTASFDMLEIAATNHHPNVFVVNVDYGGEVSAVSFKPGESKRFQLGAKIKTPKITFRCETVVPGTPEQPSSDTRALGIFLHSISYI